MKLEAISLVRILPAGAAQVGADVTRDQLRAAEVGSWAATELGDGARDDVGPLLGAQAGSVPTAGVRAPDPVDPPEPRSLDDYDRPLPLGDQAPRKGERVVVMRFGTSG